MIGKTNKRGIRWQAIVAGIIIAICHTCWLVYEETALGHLGVSFSSFMLVQSAVGVLFLLLVLNSILKRTLPRLMLSSAELMVIFTMTTISAVIAGFDLLQNLFPVLLWPHYYAGPENEMRSFFRYVPSWFIPQNKAVIKEFFIGNQDFWRAFRPDILKAWAVPMAFWAAFLFLLAFTMLTLSVILRRQWVDREKLTFPIIELPLTMVKEETVGGILRSPLLRIGFFLTAAVLSMNCLAGLYPSVPGIRLNVVNIGRTAFVIPPFSGMNPVYVAWWPYAIGLCYLIPLDISFSCWFFYAAIRLAAAFGTAQGWREPNAGFSPTEFPYFQNLTYGAWVGMFITVMWSARGHLKQVLRVTLGKEKPRDDVNEPMGYRTAVIGTFIGFIALVVIAIISGVRPHIALAFFTVYFLAIVVMTRIYAQIAVPLFELAFFSTTPFIAGVAGTSALTRQDAAILTHFHWFNRCYRQHPMGHELESFVFADRVGQSRRRMVSIIIISIVIGIVVGMLTTLQIYYNRGAASAKVLGAQVGVGWEAWNQLTTLTTNPTPPKAVTLAAILSSMGIIFLLSFIRNVSFGFPLHPIGYAFACSYAMEYIWAVVLVTWLIKLLVVRYGGLKLYKQSLPFFFGLILGDAVTQVIWGIVMSILGVKGPSPYLDMKW